MNLGSTERDDLATRARTLHFSSLVVDTHVDTTQRLLDPRFNLAVRDARGSVDIPRLREGGVGAIFFAAWVPSKVTGPAAVQRATQQIAAVRSQIDKHPKDLMLATTAEEVRAARQAGKIAILLGIEGGQMINNDLQALRKFADLGVRYMTLTHSGNVEWADSSGAVAKHNGLTPFGKEVVREMNRLGMMVDVSHVSDKTFQDVLAVSTTPVIASHSSCRALCDAPRNMTDAMIKAMAARGGVIQINFHVAFLSQKFRDAERRNPRINKAIELEVANICHGHGDEACELLEGDRLTREYVQKGELPRVDWGEIIDHIDHAVKLVGVEHVGLGSDFDGANMPYGMEDAAQLPKITEALLRRGYSEGDVRKILGENTLRLMSDVARVSSAAHPATQQH
ncbi:MAG TPA: dipeptidase [Candidatus Dormibacteraeota bacterium]|nr:dipeptidase [Candidatus Dormibacteraeota bacterium]